MTRKSTFTILVAVVLTAALASPVAASAAPGLGRMGVPKASANATRQAQFQKRLEMLQQRIARVLEGRQARFDRAASRISQRITRVSAIADRIEATGGDVSAVRALLDKARVLVEQARAEEATAVELFNAVPTGADKKAAFAAARAQAKVAMKTLQSARLTLRNAVLDLRAVANGLKAAQ
jgi:hypothetical protein